ncbi:helix-turn-helix domain-containing protein [Kitasatospora sp. NPDC098652]|uniref:helix-turn-helix domain-containing protein n=1 Tax=Kitasatospora sp. NPDC098652 TaxID=3364095 RepID=UPI0038037678
MADAGSWTDVRLRAAWASRDWAAIFREYRRAARMSQLEFGSLIGMPQSHVSLIESGKRKVTSADLIARITEGLEVPNELTGLPEPHAPKSWSPDPELSDRIAHAHTKGRIDVRSADWISRVLAEHRRAEDAIGGRDLWPVVRSQLDAVTRLLPGSSGAVADRLLILAAEHGHWLSWVAAEEGKRGPARAWLDVAHGWAMDAGSVDMVSWLTRVRSYYTLNNGDPVRALRTAEAAQRAPGDLSPAAASIAAHAAAMAAAAVGERDRSRQLAESSYELALRVPNEEERPGWLYWLDPVRAKLNLGDAAYTARDWTTAVDILQQALPELDGYPRDQAFYSARLEDARRRA